MNIKGKSSNSIFAFVYIEFLSTLETILNSPFIGCFHHRVNIVIIGVLIDASIAKLIGLPRREHNCGCA